MIDPSNVDSQSCSEKPKYKVIPCFLVWNEESDCQASEPLWSERSAQKFIDCFNAYGARGGRKKKIAIVESNAIK